MKRLSRKAVRFYVTVLLIVLFHCVLSAQGQPSSVKSGTVKGFAVDAQSKKPIEAVNFVLISIKDTSVIFGAATDKNGLFVVKDIPFGIYNAKISCIGYKTRTSKGKVLSAKNPVINLDTILLAPKNFSTGEVQITAQKERIVKEKDKYIIRPDRELGNNAFEQLENAPMVSVDVDDNFTVAGKKVTIYIDGQPAKFQGIEKNEDLKIISNIEIEKFELIIDPSLEYEETKSGAVINIVTRKTSKTKKYSASMGGDANSKNKLTGGGVVFFSAEKYSTKASFRTDGSKQESDNSSLRTLTLGTAKTNIEQTGNDLNDHTGYKGAINFNYLPEISDMFTWAVNYFKGNTDGKKNLENHISVENIDGYRFDQSKNMSEMNQEFWTGMFGYNKTFPQKGRRFMFSVAANKNRMTRDNEIDRNIGFSTIPEQKTNLLSKINSENTNSFFITKSNYRHPFENDFSFSLNGTLRYVKLNMKNSYYNLDQAAAAIYEDFSQKTNEQQKEFNYIVSGGFEGNLIGVNFGVSLGYESKIIDIENNVKNYAYSNNFNSLSPMLKLKYSLNESNDIGLNYNRLFSYPMNQQLSPYTDITDSTNFTSGNPNLKPNYADYYSLNYSYRFSNSFVRSSIDYMEMKDIIDRVTEVVSSTCTKTTYKNVSMAKNYSASVGALIRTYEWLTLDSYVSLSKTKYEGNANNTEGWRWGSWLRCGLKISPFVLQFSGNYSSASYNSQGKNDPVFKADGVIKALFFNRDLALTFRVSDIFNSSRINGTRSGDGFVFINRGNDDSRVFSFSISYYIQSKASEEIEEIRNEVSDEF